MSDRSGPDPQSARGSDPAGSRLNQDLVAEVTYIAQRSGHVRQGKVEYREMAKDIGERIPSLRPGRPSMSEEGLSGIMEKGVINPEISTLRYLVAYMRLFEPQYSAARLFVAAHYISEEDVHAYARWRWPAGWSEPVSPALQALRQSTEGIPPERLPGLAEQITDQILRAAQGDPPDTPRGERPIDAEAP